MSESTGPEDLAIVCGTRLAALLPRLSRLLAHQLKKQELPAGLSVPQYQMLRALRRRDRMPSELARLFMVSMPTVTRAVNALVAKGLIERLQDPEDGRSVRLRITEAGLHACALADSLSSRTAARLVEGLDEAALRRILATLEDLERGIPQLVGRAPAIERDASLEPAAPSAGT